MQPTPHEVWATYSVKDHCEPRAFIADVMLYDRLVLPVPPNEEVEGKVVGKETGETAHVERWNNTLCQRLARFMRMTLSFSNEPLPPLFFAAAAPNCAQLDEALFTLKAGLAAVGGTLPTSDTHVIVTHPAPPVLRTAF